MDLSVRVWVVEKDRYNYLQSTASARCVPDPSNSQETLTRIKTTYRASTAANISAEPLELAGLLNKSDCQWTDWKMLLWWKSPVTRPLMYPSWPCLHGHVALAKCIMRSLNDPWPSTARYRHVTLICLSCVKKILFQQMLSLCRSLLLLQKAVEKTDYRRDNLADDSSGSCHRVACMSFGLRQWPLLILSVSSGDHSGREILYLAFTWKCDVKASKLTNFATKIKKKARGGGCSTVGDWIRGTPYISIIYIMQAFSPSVYVSVSGQSVLQ